MIYWAVALAMNGPTGGSTRPYEKIVFETRDQCMKTKEEIAMKFLWNSRTECIPVRYVVVDGMTVLKRAIDNM